MGCKQPPPHSRRDEFWRLAAIMLKSAAFLQRDTVALCPSARLSHESESPCTWLVISTIVSKMKDFSRSQPVMYTVNVVISRKPCQMESLLLQATNRK